MKGHVEDEEHMKNMIIQR